MNDMLVLRVIVYFAPARTFAHTRHFALTAGRTNRRDSQQPLHCVNGAHVADRDRDASVGCVAWATRRDALCWAVALACVATLFSRSRTSNLLAISCSREIYEQSRAARRIYRSSIACHSAARHRYRRRRCCCLVCTRLIDKLAHSAARSASLSPIQPHGRRRRCRRRLGWLFAFSHSVFPTYAAVHIRTSSTADHRQIVVSTKIKIRNPYTFAIELLPRVGCLQSVPDNLRSRIDFTRPSCRSVRRLDSKFRIFIVSLTFPVFSIECVKCVLCLPSCQRFIWPYVSDSIDVLRLVVCVRSSSHALITLQTDERFCSREPSADI